MAITSSHPHDQSARLLNLAARGVMAELARRIDEEELGRVANRLLFELKALEP